MAEISWAVLKSRSCYTPQGFFFFPELLLLCWLHVSHMIRISPGCRVKVTVSVPSDSIKSRIEIRLNVYELLSDRSTGYAEWVIKRQTCRCVCPIFWIFWLPRCLCLLIWTVVPFLTNIYSTNYSISLLFCCNKFNGIYVIISWLMFEFHIFF